MSSRVPHAALVEWFGEFAEQGIFTTDERLVITSWNRWLERNSARAAAEVVGRGLFDAFPDLPARGLDQHYTDALSGQAHLVSHLLHRYLLPMRTRVGDQVFETMPQLARIAPLTSEDRIVGTITVIDDVSERVVAEQELRRRIEAQEAARASAEQALRVKEDFLATLSHEIRTPLNAVLGWTKILHDRPEDVSLVTRGVEVIERNTALQVRMIDDLLDTARIIAGKLRLKMDRVELRPVVLAALDVVAPAAEARQITVRYALEPTAAPVLGDPERLQQVLWNLLSNAVKFTSPGGTVSLRLEQARDTVRITVTDTGKGISPEFLPFVFDRFRQADPSSGRRESGLGLGLALVKELVNLHGGAIRARSEGLDKGTTFVMELPMLESRPGERPGTRAEAHGSQEAPGLKGLRVLLVEDDRDARDLLRTALELEGIRVTEAASAAEALDLLAGSEPPDAIVADLGLAGEDGYDLMERLRRLAAGTARAVPAIAISAYVGDEHRARARAAGYHDCLAKPLDVTTLLQALARALRQDV